MNEEETREYYKANRDKILEKKRKYYQDKKGDEQMKKIIHQCGCEIEKPTPRQEKHRNYLEQIECSICVAERANKSFPPLTGTESQIRWAKQIRAKYVNEFGNDENINKRTYSGDWIKWSLSGDFGEAND